MFDLHRLRLLRELKHRGTLAAVAAALSYSPSSISQQLSQLESEVGVRLLEPVGRRVRLTPRAEILIAHTEAVLERLEQAEADIAASLTDLTGTLRIASFQTAALALVPTALTLLREAHPNLRIHVT
jgi:DNA-binding transcriptional LysR family regulator